MENDILTYKLKGVWGKMPKKAGNYCCRCLHNLRSAATDSRESGNSWSTSADDISPIYCPCQQILVQYADMPLPHSAITRLCPIHSPHQAKSLLIMVALCNTADHYIFIL